ncbi:MAG: PRC-barrel domain-containing protein [Opitutaceae bacterium]
MSHPFVASRQSSFVSLFEEGAMESKHIVGLPVVTLGGVRVGTVDQIFVNATTKRIVDFVLDADEDRPGVAARIVNGDDVHALGEDALTVSNSITARDAATDARLSGLVRLDDMATRQVMTESGTLLGHLVSVEIDPSTLQLTRVEISPGVLRGKLWIAADRVIRLGADAIMVADASAEPANEAIPLGPVGANAIT